MSFDIVPPPAHESISYATVAQLLVEQMPQYAGLEIGRHYEGWDCAMFKLGPDLAVRLPRTADAVRFLLAESLWVPRLASGWTFPSPKLMATGQPGAGFPWPWAVVTWVEGDTADAVPLLASEGAAVGRALGEVHLIAPDDAPYNIEQSIPMAERSPKVEHRVAVLSAGSGPGGERLDATAARSLWADALAAAAPERHEFVWSHADLHGANVLSHAGRFGGIVDWGSMAACDPAVDVGFTHSLLPAEGVADVFEAYHGVTGRVDDAFVARARGVALSKCVGIAMVERPVTRAMGWRGLVALGVAG